MDLDESMQAGRRRRRRRRRRRFGDARRRRTHYERRRRCSTGQYKDQGANNCKDCTPGHFQPVVGTHDQTSCPACAAGKFQPATKAVACSDCPAHHYNTATAQTSCTAHCRTVCPIDGEHAPSCGGATKGTCEHVLAFGGNPQCTDCPATTFSDVEGAKTCKVCNYMCPAGRYHAGCGLQGPGACQSCAPGQFKPKASALGCTACATGRYQSATESTSCAACAAGQYQDSTGTVGCKTCHTHCAAGEDHSGCGGSVGGACEACDAGSAKAVAGTHSCAQCVSGKYHEAQKQTSCKDCPAGKFEPAFGQTTCQTCNYSCSAGHDHRGCGGSAAGMCQACDQGRSKASAGTWGCSDCTSGQFQASTGQLGCSACDYHCPDGQEHTACGASNAGVCQACVPGRFIAASALSHGHNPVCGMCAAGTFADSAGQTACTACSAGRYQPLSGQSACRSCALGFAAAPGSVACSKCTAGTFAGRGAAGCTPCGSNELFAPAGAESCATCGAGSRTNGGGGDGRTRSTCSECDNKCCCDPRRHKSASTTCAMQKHRCERVYDKGGRPFCDSGPRCQLGHNPTHSCRQGAANCQECGGGAHTAVFHSIRVFHPFSTKNVHKHRCSMVSSSECACCDCTNSVTNEAAPTTTAAPAATTPPPTLFSFFGASATSP